MSKIVTKLLATGATVSMVTLSGFAPVAAAPLGSDSQKEAGSEAGTPESSQPGEDSSSAGTEASAHAAAEGTKVQLLNITDFHGRIAEAGTEVASVIEEERAKYADEDDTAGTAFLSAGDNIGASTYVSSSQEDTPTLDVLNAMGLQASAVGNHEFDRGSDDLTNRVSGEADFPYLAANVYDKGSDDEEVVDGLEEYTTIDVGGVKIAVIGVVTKETTSLVSPDGIDTLKFGDPTDAVNRVSAEIEALPDAERPDMTVVEAHLGASDTDSLEDAKASNAEFKKLVTEADAAVDVLFTGHTHLPYSFEAPISGEPERTRPVLEAGNYGELVGQVQLEADANGNWTTKKAELLPTEEKSYDSPVVDEVEKIVAAADERAKVPGSVVAGEITEDITRATKDGNEDRGAESTLGNLVADALKDGVEDTQLETADFGITNPGGLREDLKCEHIYNDEKECEVTAAELNGVLPFANDHGVVTMKGSDVIGLFEEQWQPEGSRNPFLHLGISDELDVIYDSEAATDEHVKSVKVEGKTIDPNQDYRVATLSFLAAGGDNFKSFATGEFELSGVTDFETWVDYFNDNTPVPPDTDERQADLAHDVINNGDLTVDLKAPEDGIEPGESKDFVLNTSAEEEIPGPVDVTVDLPEGYTVSAAEPASAGSAKAKKSATVKAPELTVNAAEQTMTLESISAGESELPITVSAPEDAKDKVTLVVDLIAGDADWWDDNPLPLSHEFEATAKVVDDAAASAEAEGSADSAGADDNANGTADADGSDANADGADANADGASANSSASTSATADSSGGDGNSANADSSKDGGDLPRTGFEAMNVLAAALALIVAGGAAVTIVRRRKVTV